MALTESRCWCSSDTSSKPHSRITCSLVALKKVYKASCGASLSRLETLVVCTLYFIVFFFNIDVDTFVGKFDVFFDILSDILNPDIERADHLIEREKPSCEEHASDH
jgi:hypothetical protein